MYTLHLSFKFQSEGEENPGAIIASYLQTSLDTITGGGSVCNTTFTY